MHNLDEIIKSQRFHPSVQPRLERAQQSTPQGPDSDACKSEMAYRMAFAAAVTKTMDQLKLDAFVYPTRTPCSEPITNEQVKFYDDLIMEQSTAAHR